MLKNLDKSSSPFSWADKINIIFLFCRKLWSVEPVEQIINLEPSYLIYGHRI